MATITAVFDSPSSAHRAVGDLKDRGIDESRIGLLAPGDHAVGKGSGAALGGILGMGAATFLIPGLGPIAGIGIIAGALAGAGLGAAAGAAVEHKSDVPKEDLYFVENGLRHGNAVVLVEAQDDATETQVRNLLEHSGGRSIESLRREWWQGLRDGEREHVQQTGRAWSENDYRSGFEAALHPATRGREYQQVTAYVESCYPGPCKTEAFRLGFDRGRQYLHGRSGWQVH
ncbi:MAG TPA: hypothetical protein VFT12_15205 [Thermoanaerobaculia bacterium]|nr:hypothetical protein [Thermoanaerobaculia bacterium]